MRAFTETRLDRNFVRKYAGSERISGVINTRGMFR